jgi:hypothetical protein
MSNEQFSTQANHSIPEACSKSPPAPNVAIELVFDRLAKHGCRPQWTTHRHQIVAFCPAGCDSKMSLLVEDESNRDYHIICSAGCSMKDIYAALNLSAIDNHVTDDDMSGESQSARDLLDNVSRFIRRFVVLPDAACEAAVALFVLHTWALDAAYTTPYLLVVSPEKQAGKSRLLEVLGFVVRQPWRTVSATEAALFRKIEQDTPTLLLDEIDAIFGSNTDRTEALRAVLNAGNRRGASATRVVGQGTNMEVREFVVFCPKVLAGIDTGRLPETISDRAIVMHMKRRHGGERVERLRERFMPAEAEPLVSALEEWATAAVDALRTAEPELPDVLSDRAADAWEPLFAIADHAGGEWRTKARAAAIDLSAATDGEETSNGALLLRAVRDAMAGREIIATVDLLAAINADDELPFGGWREGKGLDARTLARMLRRYGPRPRTVRVGDATAKGYHAEDLADAWARYLPPSHASHADQQSPEHPREQRDVTDVTHVTESEDDQLT